MSFWSQSVEIARIDLRIERRIGESLRIVLPFAVVSLVVFPIALGFQLSVIGLIGPAVFWALGILFGMQVALRQAATDTQERRDQQALVGLDPAARFVGRVLSGSFLTAAFLAALFVAMLVLYGPEIPNGSIGVLLVTASLLAIGLTELGTLAGEITFGLRNRTALASLIVVPLALPLVVGASQALESQARGESILPWVLLMIASGLALAVLGVALARPLEEASR